MLKASVIIPTYNQARYLDQALRSIFAQSLSPYEVIVVDDGSNDNTDEIVRQFGPKVRYFRHEHNRGVSAARNSGLALAQGDLIAWLDGDDLWEPAFLGTVIPVLEGDSSVDGIYTGCTHIDDAGNILPQSGSRVVPPVDLYSALAEDCFVLTPTIVVRKRCFEQVGQFDSQFRICEDYDMWLRLAKEFTIRGLPLPLVRIRVHQNNTVRNTDAFCRFRLALTEKHFGPPEGDPHEWPTEKRRAHGHALRAAAFKCIESGLADQGSHYLEEAVSIWPALLGRLDTFYELAIGDQPRGYRGEAQRLDIENNGAEMLSRLHTLFTRAGPALEPMQGVAYGNAYLALCILSDQAGRWSAARGFILQAIRANPRLLASYPVLRRLLKLLAGSRLVGLGRRLLDSPQIASIRGDTV